MSLFSPPFMLYKRRYSTHNLFGKIPVKPKYSSQGFQIRCLQRQKYFNQLSKFQNSLIHSRQKQYNIYAGGYPKQYAGQRIHHRPKSARKEYNSYKTQTSQHKHGKTSGLLTDRSTTYSPPKFEKPDFAQIINLRNLEKEKRYKSKLEITQKLINIIQNNANYPTLDVSKVKNPDEFAKSAIQWKVSNMKANQQRVFKSGLEKSGKRARNSFGKVWIQRLRNDRNIMKQMKKIEMKTRLSGKKKQKYFVSIIPETVKYPDELIDFPTPEKISEFVTGEQQNIIFKSVNKNNSENHNLLFERSAKLKRKIENVFSSINTDRKILVDVKTKIKEFESFYLQDTNVTKIF